jgi:hypothetical protein
LLLGLSVICSKFVDPWRDDPEASSDDEGQDHGIASEGREEGDSDEDVANSYKACSCSYCKFDEDPGMPNKCCGSDPCLTKKHSGT